MSSVYIAKRKLKPADDGRERSSWHVKLEEGRAGRAKHLGSYPTKELARKRAKAVREQLARGETPTLRIQQEATTRRMSDVSQAWLATRVDVADSTMRSFKFSVGLFDKKWGSDDPASIQVDDLQAWINESKHKAGTLRLILSHLSQILEYADVEPNPVASKKLRKPRQTKQKAGLPTKSELAAMYKLLPEKNRAPVAMMEHGGLRIGEVVALTWADIFRSRSYLVVRDAKSEAGERIVRQIEGLPELPPRPDGAKDVDRVFSNVTEQSIASAMRKACKDADVPHLNPHRLRKLHCSRLLHDGILDPAGIAARVGHASPALTLAVYSLIVPPEE